MTDQIKKSHTATCNDFSQVWEKIVTSVWESQTRCDDAEEHARAALAAIEAAGYRVVPVEPTEAMEMDGKCELIALAADLATSKWAAKKVYEAMVQAAPKVNE